MFKPIDTSRYLGKNYRIMLEDYNLFLFTVTFIITPKLLTAGVMVFINSDNITSIINSSIAFFSIIVGFLINVLVLLLGKAKTEKKDSFSKDIEKLRKHLSFNILNSIIFGIALVVLILFYGNYTIIINIKGLTINISEFLILFLF